MKLKTLYQTLEDRGNPDDIEANAPYPCKKDQAWLGPGYYLWDTFIDNAHWWGEINYNSSYVIIEANCDFDRTICFDLVGDTDHMLDFNESIEYLKNQNLINGKTTVARILHHIKSKVKNFNYQAIRVYGVNSISGFKTENETFIHRLYFGQSSKQYLDYTPAIQICIFKQNGLNVRNIKIVYPDEYVDYVI